jgi:hypothetical protein
LFIGKAMGLWAVYHSEMIMIQSKNMNHMNMIYSSLYYYIELHEPANLTTSAFVVRVGFLATMSNMRWHTPVCFQEVRILLRVHG